MALKRAALRLSPLVLALALSPAAAQETSFDPTGVDPALAETIELCTDLILSPKSAIAALESDGWSVSLYGDEPYFSDVTGDRSAENGPSEALYLGMERYPEQSLAYCNVDVSNSGAPSIDGLSQAFSGARYEQSADGAYAIWNDNGLLGRVSTTSGGFFVQITRIEEN